MGSEVGRASSPHPNGDVFFVVDGHLVDSGLLWVASGYLVEGGRVLLVFHNRFRLWVPPGGHLEPGETFAQAAVREFREETGIEVEAISCAPAIHDNDENATRSPLPFYTDRLVEGFRKPAIAEYFFVRRTPGGDVKEARPQLAEVDDIGWFDHEAIGRIPTFDQVRSVSRWALKHHPDSGGE